MRFRALEPEERGASGGGTASWVGVLLLLAAAALPGCWIPPAPEPLVFHAPPPSEAQRYCAWFGDAREGTLYFGKAAFWWAKREAGGDPTAELAHPGPQRVGRFDLRGLRFLAPLDVSAGQERHGGVWDVLAHPNGRVYFTTFFDEAGFVEPATGAVTRLPDAGPGLNELALGEGGAILVTRYGGDADQGSVVVLDADGAVRAEHALEPVAGYRAAAKSVAWDPVRREIWVNTDLLPEDPGEAPRYDVRVLDPGGMELLRYEWPEVQFMAFAPDGTGFFAEHEDGKLWLRVRPPGLAWRARAGRRILLDADYPGALDFAQEIRVAEDGSLLVTRWSGRLHHVSPEGRVRHLELPRPDAAGIYYTAVAADGLLCATFCGDVTVVCQPLP